MASTNVTQAFPLTPELTCDTAAAGRYGETLHDAYVSAQPYPHIQIDGFLQPAILEQVLADVEFRRNADEHYNNNQEKLRYLYHPDNLPAHTCNLFRFFNSRAFTVFLEKLTGIRGLITDPMFVGAGVHETKTGGHLDIHADFNFHGALRVERRINVLIYLNHGWERAFGGSFEVWEKDMSARVKSIESVFNRCVIFNTATDSYHGNPDPIAHPNGRSRFAIALYYYTATWDGSRSEHSTLWKKRPGTADEVDSTVAVFDWKEMTKTVARELAPPIVLRNVKKFVKRTKAHNEP